MRRTIRVSMFPVRLFEMIQGFFLNMCADLEIWTAETNGDEDKQGGDCREEGDGGRGTEAGGAEVRTDEIGYKSEEMRDDGAREQMRATRGGKDARGDSRERGAGGRTGEEGDGEETNVRK